MQKIRYFIENSTYLCGKNGRGAPVPSMFPNLSGGCTPQRRILPFRGRTTLGGPTPQRKIYPRGNGSYTPGGGLVQREQGKLYPWGGGYPLIDRGSIETETAQPSLQTTLFEAPTLLLPPNFRNLRLPPRLPKSPASMAIPPFVLFIPTPEGKLPLVGVDCVAARTVWHGCHP